MDALHRVREQLQELALEFREEKSSFLWAAAFVLEVAKLATTSRTCESQPSAPMRKTYIKNKRPELSRGRFAAMEAMIYGSWSYAQ